jgi:hypothetical protein
MHHAGTSVRFPTLNAMDRHKIWRIVRSNLESLRRVAPAGYAPVVDVYVAGRLEPVRLNEVHTSREAEFPWTLLSEGEVNDDGALSKDDRSVFVPEGHIARIEISFVASEDRPLGFAHRDDLDSRSSDE